MMPSQLNKNALVIAEQIAPNEQRLPSIYENWPGDPGPSALDWPPFPIRIGEQLIISGLPVYFKRRATDGSFLFTPDNGAADFNRSAWRLEKEFDHNLLDRIDRRSPVAQDQAKQRLQEADAAFIERNATCGFKTSAVRNKAYIDDIRNEDERRVRNGLLPLARTGPRSRGGIATLKADPKNVAEQIAKTAKKLNDPRPPSWKTICKKLHKLRNVDNITLLDAGDKRGLRVFPLRLHDRTEELIDDVLSERFMHIGGESLKSIRMHLSVKVANENTRRAKDDQLKTPSIKAIRKRIEAIDGMDLMAATKGKDKARDFYRITGKMELPDEPLVEVEFDWKLCRVWVRHDDPRAAKHNGEQLIFKFWKGVFVDRFNGDVLSYFLTVRSPSIAELMAALRDLVVPLPEKTRLSLWRNEVPVIRGIPSTIFTDRGPELMANSTGLSLNDFGIAVRPLAARRPDDKGTVESLHQAEDKELFSKMPGYVAKGQSDPNLLPKNTEELLSARQLAKKIETYYTEYRRHKRAETRLASPARLLADFRMKNPSWTPNTASSIQEIDHVFTLRDQRVATKEGVRKGDLYWNSEWIRQIRKDLHAHRKGNPKVEIMIRPHDLSAIYVEHPITGERRLVPSMQPSYTSTVDWFQHQRVINAKNHIQKLDHEEDEEYLARIYVSLVDVKRDIGKRRGRSVRDASAFLQAGTGSSGAGAYAIDTRDMILKGGSPIARVAAETSANDNSEVSASSAYEIGADDAAEFDLESAMRTLSDADFGDDE